MIESSLQATPVLVCGGAGYIGSHMCKQLAQAGYLPVTFDNLSTGHRWAVQWGPLIEGDLLDTHALRDAFARWPFAAVMHFAALSQVGQSMAEPERYFRNNVTGTLNLSANDTLHVAINPYLLRPNSAESVVTGDWGTLVLVHADTIIGEFDAITGVSSDMIGWTQLPTQTNSGRLPSTLGLNEWELEYRTGYGPLSGGDVLLLHYRVSGSVPEPASAGLLIAGALLLRSLSRRRG